MDTVLKEKGGTDIEGLKTQLSKSTSSLQYALDSNSALIGQNKDLVAKLAQLKLDNDALLTRCLNAEEEEKVLSVENDSLKQSLTDMTMTYYAEQDNTERLQMTLHKVGEDFHRTQDFVLHQHELGFNKALDQVAHFYDIPLNKGKFDMKKDFYKGSSCWSLTYRRMMVAKSLLSRQPLVLKM